MAAPSRRCKAGWLHGPPALQEAQQRKTWRRILLAAEAITAPPAGCPPAEICHSDAAMAASTVGCTTADLGNSDAAVALEAILTCIVQKKWIYNEIAPLKTEIDPDASVMKQSPSKQAKHKWL